MNTEIFYNDSDTICAISTPPGSGGVAMARVSGSRAFEIVGRLWRGKNIEGMKSHTAHLGEIVDPADGSVLDQAVITVFRSPASFTGDDVVEISVHGSRWIQRRLINALVEAGARLALPGEYTRRAFSAGKLDLAEAEAVADVIASSSAAAHRLALNQMRGGFSRRLAQLREKLVELASLLELELDFSEEDVEFASRAKLRSLADESAAALKRLADSFATGAAIKDGFPVAIIGKTNVGKSSLLNALLDDDRSIVSDIHGTTRDVVEDTAEIGPYMVRFKDTAGIRHTDNPIENMGIDRSRKAASTADLVLCVLDASAPATDGIGAEDIDERRMIVVLNKCDVADAGAAADEARQLLPDVPVVAVSALRHQGIDELRAAIVDKLDELGGADSESDLIVTNARHAEALAAAASALRDVVAGLDNGLPPDLVAQDLRQAIHHLSSITGQITTPEILQSIFTHFCIGK